jgi:hypothetical protein
MAVQGEMWSDAHLWRARALTAAVITGSRETGAGLLLQHFFALIGGVKEGDAVAYENARSILEEIKRLVPEGTPEWARLFNRLYLEKLALSYLMQGTDGGSPLPHARECLETAKACYSRALEVARGSRDELKVRGGLALVRYLLSAYGNSASAVVERESAREETVKVRAAAKVNGYRDVEEWASINFLVMERSVFQGWTPYEVL